MEQFVKKSKITPNLKKAIWDIYIGVGIQDCACPLCGIYELHRNTNSGFEAAHIVANKFFTDTLTTLYLFPSCSICNNECADLCLLDFLWVRERYDVLRTMIWAIFTHFQKQRPNEPENQAWKILQYLYGRERFPAGGGIVNRRQIYQMARNVQMDAILRESAELNRQMQINNAILQRLLEEKSETSQFV